MKIYIATSLYTLISGVSLEGRLSHFCPGKNNISSPFSFISVAFCLTSDFQAEGLQIAKAWNVKKETMLCPAGRTRACIFYVASLSTGYWRCCWSNTLTAKAVTFWASIAVIGMWRDHHHPLQRLGLHMKWLQSFKSLPSVCFLLTDLWPLLLEEHAHSWVPGLAR